MSDPAHDVHPALRPLLDGGVDALRLGDIDALRAARRLAAVQRSGPPQAVRNVVDVAEAGVRMRVYEPMDRTSAATLAVIHGGGWVWGGIDEIDALSRALANATGRLTAAVGYRLAPEHRYPVALDDMSAAISWLRTNAQTWGANGHDLALLGLSAGGNLAAATSTRLRGSAFEIAAQVLVYPMLDPSANSASAHRYASLPTLSLERVAWFWAQYAPGRTTEPGVAPAFEPDVTGLPPTFLVLAEHDVLRDEGLAYAERLRAASVPTACTVVPHVVHGFLPMAGLVPQVCAGVVSDIAQWLAGVPTGFRTGTATP